MRKKKIIFAGLFIVIFICILYWFLTVTGIFINNKVSVNVDDHLSVDKVRIEFGFYSINSNYQSDSVMIKKGLAKTLFDGRAKGPFKTICGENDFLIVYDNSYYTVIRHFIPNNFHSGIPDAHKYDFNLKKNGDKMYLILDIIGPDGERFEKQLARVSNAGKNFWGKPKRVVKR